MVSFIDWIAGINSGVNNSQQLDVAARANNVERGGWPPRSGTRTLPSHGSAGRLQHSVPQLSAGPFAFLRRCE